MADGEIQLDAVVKLNQSSAVEAGTLGGKLFNDSFKIAPDFSKLTTSLSGGTAGFNQLTESSRNFGDSLERGLSRITALGVASAALFGIARAFESSLKAAKDFEAAIKDINVNVNLPSDKIAGFGQQLFDIAKQTRSSFAEVADAAKDFARQGLDATAVLDRTRAALLLTSVAGVDYQKSIQAITAGINNFSKEGLTAEQIVNKLVAVDSKFAVSSADLASAITKVGAAAQDSGVGFDKLISLIAGAQQTTQRGGEVISNALNTIFTRLKREDTLDSLEQLGVQVRQVDEATGRLTGNLLPADKILSQLADKYKNLTQEQRANVAEQISGVRQTAILTGLLQGLGVAQEAYTASVNASDEALKRQSDILTTQDSKLKSLSTSFQQLGANVGQVGFGDFINKQLSGLSTGQGGSPLSNLAGETIKAFSGTGTTIGEQVAGDFAKVFIKSIGDIITGPGLVAIGAIGYKIAQVLADFAGKQFAQANPFAKIDTQLQANVNELLNTQGEAVAKILQTEDNKITAETKILNLLREQNIALTERASLGARANEILTSPQARAVIAARPITNAANGLIDAVSREQSAISSGVGGASPSAKPVFIPNFNGGPAVANTDEYMVPNYAGTGRSAILNKKLISELGLPENANKITESSIFPFSKPSFKPQFKESFKSPNIHTVTKSEVLRNTSAPIGKLLQSGAFSEEELIKLLDTGTLPLSHGYLPNYANFNIDTLRQIVDKENLSGRGLPINIRNKKQIDVAKILSSQIGVNPHELLLDSEFQSEFRKLVPSLSSGHVPNFANIRPPIEFVKKQIPILKNAFEKSGRHISEEKLLQLLTTQPDPFFDKVKAFESEFKEHPERFISASKGFVPNFAPGDVRFSGNSFQVEGTKGRYVGGVTDETKSIIQSLGQDFAGSLIQKERSLGRALSEDEFKNLLLKTSQSVAVQNPLGSLGNTNVPNIPITSFTTPASNQRPIPFTPGSGGNIIPQAEQVPQPFVPTPQGGNVGNLPPSEIPRLKDVETTNANLIAKEVDDSILKTISERGKQAIGSIKREQNIPSTFSPSLNVNNPENLQNIASAAATFIPPINRGEVNPVPFTSTRARAGGFNDFSLPQPNKIPNLSDLRNIQNAGGDLNNQIKNTISQNLKGFGDEIVQNTEIFKVLKDIGTKHSNTLKTYTKALEEGTITQEQFNGLSKKVQQSLNEEVQQVQSRVAAGKNPISTLPKESFGERARSLAGIGAFALPIAAEAASAVVGNSINDPFTRNRTQGALSTLGSGLGTAAFAAQLVPGPLGLAAAGGISAITAVQATKQAFGEKTPEERAQQLDDFVKEIGQQRDAISNANKAVFDFRNALEDTTVSEKDRARLQREALSATRNINDPRVSGALRQQILSGDVSNQSTEKINALLERAFTNQQNQIALNPNNISSVFEKAFKETSPQTFLGFKTKIGPEGISNETSTGLRQIVEAQINQGKDAEERQNIAKDLASNTKESSISIRAALDSFNRNSKLGNAGAASDNLKQISDAILKGLPESARTPENISKIQDIRLGRNFDDIAKFQAIIQESAKIASDSLKDTSVSVEKFHATINVTTASLQKLGEFSLQNIQRGSEFNIQRNQRVITQGTELQVARNFGVGSNEIQFKEFSNNITNAVADEQRQQFDKTREALNEFVPKFLTGKQGIESRDILGGQDSVNKLIDTLGKTENIEDFRNSILHLYGELSNASNASTNGAKDLGLFIKKLDDSDASISASTQEVIKNTQAQQESAIVINRLNPNKNQEILGINQQISQSRFIGGLSPQTTEEIDQSNKERLGVLNRVSNFTQGLGVNPSSELEQSRGELAKQTLLSDIRNSRNNLLNTDFTGVPNSLQTKGSIIESLNAAQKEIENRTPAEILKLQNGGNKASDLNDVVKEINSGELVKSLSTAVKDGIGLTYGGDKIPVGGELSLTLNADQVSQIQNDILGEVIKQFGDKFAKVDFTLDTHKNDIKAITKNTNTTLAPRQEQPNTAKP